MAIEFTCQAAGEILPGSAHVAESPSTPLLFPRLNKFAAANLDVKNLFSVTLLHFTVPKKDQPSRLSYNFGQPFEDVCKLEKSAPRAQLQDMNWLLSLFNLTDDDIPLEWPGYMTKLSRDQNIVSPQPPTPFASGPLIDAHAPHPDKVMGRGNNGVLQEVLADSSHVFSSHLPGYAIVHGRSAGEVVRSRKVERSHCASWGHVQRDMSFIGCMGNLIKGSGLEELIGAAYSGLAGILSGKSWPRAIRAFRIACSVVMSDYLGGDDSHTFDELTAYLEEARKTYCTVSTIATSLGAKLDPYNAPPTTVVFDGYVSVKDHETERSATGVCAGTYNLTLTSPLPNREVIMKSKAKKQLLSCLLCTCTLAPNMLLVGEDEGLFNHEEADVLMVSFMVYAVRAGNKVIRILSDEMHIFWVRKLSIKAQMEQWDGTVLHIPLLGVHAVTGCDSVSYPFNKGKFTALSRLREGNFPELYSVVGEETATLKDFMKTGQTFFAVLHGQPKCTSLNAARYTIYTKKKGKPTST